MSITRLLVDLPELLAGALGTVYSAAGAQVRWRGEVVYSGFLGTLDPEGQLDSEQRVNPDTLFDFASLTKLATTSAFLRLADAGIVKIEDRVSKILPEFSGIRQIRPYPNPLNTGELVEVVPPTDETVDASAITFFDLLTHSSGLPAWLNLRDGGDIDARFAMCLQSDFSYPPGTRVVYSDIGFILLGIAIARKNGTDLQAAMQSLVLRPFGLNARYGPIAENVAPTEYDQQWRGRRIVGEVHDENAASLGGVAGHAGLFGTVTDAASLGEIYLKHGDMLLSPEIADAATTRQIEDRGLGWMMRSPGGSSGQYFSAESYGHTGFVGNSLWVDPERELICALLTNNVFYGREKDNIVAFRKRFHDTIIEALEDR